MYELQQQLANNPLTCKQDVAQALLDMVRPLESLFSDGKANVNFGFTGVHYGNKAAGIEGFSRLVWGLGPLFAGRQSDYLENQRSEIEKWYHIVRTGLLNGTNPQHPEFWGALKDYSQVMVEMAALAAYIILNRERLWTSFLDKERKQIFEWFDQINKYKVHPNNWRFFRILVNMMFQVLQLPFSQKNLKDDMGIIEKCYLGDGWYFDGHRHQLEYYIPFAMHFYGLLYAGVMKEQDSERSANYINRGKKFIEDFPYWFSSNGAAVPFGRSLTYRFAHSAYFASLAFSTDEKLEWDIIKGGYLRNLRYWFRKPIFDNAGVMSIGYEYPNLIMSEKYNAPGSPYWAFKSFLALAIDDDHPFWVAGESFPTLAELKPLKHAFMLASHPVGTDQVQLYIAGQHCMQHSNSEAKYEKFVYSSQFGFSVSRGSSLAEGAFDSTLAVSLADENHYRMRYGNKESKLYDNGYKTTYTIGLRVQVESYIIPIGLWHVRVHNIKTSEAIDIADGGFAIPFYESMDYANGYFPENTSANMNTTVNDLSITLPWAFSRVVGYQEGEVEGVISFPNTNLMSGFAIIPTFKKRLEAGQHQIVTAFIADRKLSFLKTNEVPKVSIAEENIKVKYGDKLSILPFSSKGFKMNQ